MSEQETGADSQPGSPMSAAEVLDREYLEMRSLILRLAASFDRIERSEQPKPNPEMLKRLKDGVEILIDDKDDRAARVQKLFSLEYQQDWHKQFGLTIEK